MASEDSKKDPAWKYAYLQNKIDTNSVTCKFCGKVTKGGIFRAKQHLVGGFRNSKACLKCPDQVKEELREFMLRKKTQKEQMNLVHDFDDEVFGYGEDEEDEVAEIDQFGKNILRSSGSGKKISGSSGSKGSYSVKSVQSKLKKRRQFGPMDSYFTTNQELVKQNKKDVKGKQTTINDAHRKELRVRACTMFSRWMYDAGIPFNAVKYDSFGPALEAVAQYGPGMKPLTSYEVRVPYLKKEVANIQNIMQKHKEEWVRNGCSIMSDGWKDNRERNLINFLVNCQHGTLFIESIDASSYMKTGERLFEMLDKMVERIGEANVVQVITDSASNYVAAGKLLEAKRPHLYWTPCAAHCIDLMLEDIGKLPILKRTIQRAIQFIGYIYNRSGLLNMMRHFTGQRKLLRPGKTRFATAFLTLSSIHKHKDSLRKMFTSEDWTASKWSKDLCGKKVSQIVLMPSFWNNVVYLLKLSSPLVRVLRLVDGEKKPPMGYIYKAMDRAKEAIAKAFNGKEEKYKEIFKIIDERWNCQLCRPLHAAGHFLNPEFFYSNPAIEQDEEVMMGLHKCIERLVPNVDQQDKISEEFSLYRNSKGIFGLDMAMRQRNKMAPADWWGAYGSSTPTLQRFAIKILNLTCSASSCERNWSMFEHVHSKKRNRLAQSHLNDLVFVKYNRALIRQFKLRYAIDPISLKDIDEGNEWLIGRMDSDNDECEDDDFVFDDKPLTWGRVGRASGAGEAFFTIRSSVRATPRGMASSFSTSSSIQTLNVKIEEAEETEEEDDEGYKSDMEEDNVLFDDDD